MAHTLVRDVVIWTKHVHGGDLAARLEALPGDETVNLVVDGVAGAWCKMRDGKDGRPTHGLRPVGRAQQFWKALYESRRGDSVSIGLADQMPGVAETAGPFIYPPTARSEAERQAALHALLNVKGYRSDGSKMTRDEMHDR